MKAGTYYWLLVFFFVVFPGFMGAVKIPFDPLNLAKISHGRSDDIGPCLRIQDHNALFSYDGLKFTLIFIAVVFKTNYRDQQSSP